MFNFLTRLLAPMFILLGLMLLTGGVPILLACFLLTVALLGGVFWAGEKEKNPTKIW